jgi:hypothetical protein
MSIETVAKWIEASGPAQAIAQSAWAFPVIETVHVIAIAMVVGSIAAVDLRLLNIAWKERPAADVAGELLPWTWACFVVAAIAGVLMFISAATKYVTDLPFQLKMLLLVLAGNNMLVFHFFVDRDAGSWTRDTPKAAKVSAALSLAFWIAIVICGRLVSFTTQDQFGPPSVSDASGVVATAQNA